MTTTLSTKGQVVLPKRARARLQLQPGAKLLCKVQGDSIVLTPEQPVTEEPRLVTDSKSGLRITKSFSKKKVTRCGRPCWITMRYLLDANTLIALAHTGHSLHGKTIMWYLSVADSATGFLLDHGAGFRAGFSDDRFATAY